MIKLIVMIILVLLALYFVNSSHSSQYMSIELPRDQWAFTYEDATEVGNSIR